MFLFFKYNLNLVKNGRKTKGLLLDCYLDETNSSINVCEVENLISKEQANYLRKNFYGGNYLLGFTIFPT